MCGRQCAQHGAVQQPRGSGARQASPPGAPGGRQHQAMQRCGQITLWAEGGGRPAHCPATARPPYRLRLQRDQRDEAGEQAGCELRNLSQGLLQHPARGRVGREGEQACQ